MKSKFLTLGALVAAVAIVVQPAFSQNSSSALDQPPRAVSQLAPVYSAYLRHADVEGSVVVAFTVTPSGDVTNAAIVSSTDRLLNEPTLRAIVRWKFMPAVKAGLPVSSRVNERVTFSIPDAPR
jgi:TonB family protein